MADNLNLLLILLPAAHIILANVHVVKVQTDPNGQNTKRAVCELPLAVGNCTRKFTRFYWDGERGHCHKFFYTGCGGNGNRFLSRHQCKKRCSPKFHEKHKKTRIAARLSTLKRDDPTCLAINCTNGFCDERGKCRCRKGFELAANGSGCIDSNECLWTKCAENARCVNLVGSFRCECLPGFAGSGLNCTKQRNVCAQWFDRRYEHQCQAEAEWVPRWYFHLRSGGCRQFWYGGCQFGESQNFFRDQQSCESICGGFSSEDFFTDQSGQSNAQTVQNQAASTKNISSACLDPFDESLRQPCTDGIWKRRYFYDTTASRCRVFWMDVSCPRANMAVQKTSRNVFTHLTSCKRACEGEQQQQVEDWAVEQWHSQNGGTASGVIQASFVREQQTATQQAKEDCKQTSLADSVLAQKSAQAKKERLARLKAKLKEERRQKQKLGQNANGWPASACMDKFDWNLTKNCGSGPWNVRFFFDSRLTKCRPFWTNGCPGNTRNQFGDEKSCQQMCEHGEANRHWPSAGIAANLMEKTGGACVEPFDNQYRRACHNGKFWRRKWFFDQHTGFCRYFWYDGCKGRSRNIFDGLKECMDTCLGDEETPPKPLPTDPTTIPTTTTRKFAYFGSGEMEMAADSMGFWSFRKNYLRSAQLALAETECTGFRYNNSTGNGRLSAFFCLLEEGGGCQMAILVASKNGIQQCHISRPWLKGKHLYAWFFTLERSAISDFNNGTGRRPASGVLTLRQTDLNNTDSVLVIPIEPFGKQNETIATVDLLPPAKNCHQIC